jgi:hypothetical protein
MPTLTDAEITEFIRRAVDSTDSYGRKQFTKMLLAERAADKAALKAAKDYLYFRVRNSESREANELPTEAEQRELNDSCDRWNKAAEATED